MVCFKRACVSYTLLCILCSKINNSTVRCQLRKRLKEITWINVNEVAKVVCPNVLRFVNLLLLLPASSADCERGFSVTKLIKSDWRSKLHDKKVTNLMTVQLNSPEIPQFDPLSSIQRWLNTRKGRKSFSEQDPESDGEDTLMKGSSFQDDPCSSSAAVS